LANREKRFDIKQGKKRVSSGWGGFHPAVS